jgi:hypothetical protein
VPAVGKPAAMEPPDYIYGRFYAGGDPAPGPGSVCDAPEVDGAAGPVPCAPREGTWYDDWYRDGGDSDVAGSPTP